MGTRKVRSSKKFSKKKVSGKYVPNSWEIIFPVKKRSGTEEYQEFEAGLGTL